MGDPKIPHVEYPKIPHASVITQAVTTCTIVHVPVYCVMTLAWGRFCFDTKFSFHFIHLFSHRVKQSLQSNQYIGENGLQGSLQRLYETYNSAMSV